MMLRRPDDAAAPRAQPFVAHLDDLRRALAVSLGAVAAGVLLAMPLAPLILRALKQPLARAGLDPDTYLRVLHMTGGMAVTLRIGLWSGLVAALPVVTAAALWFVFPGLRAVERRAVRRGLTASALLFAAGVASAYAIVLPVAIRFMLAINAWLGIPNEFVELGDYVRFMLRLLAAFGLAYQLPVIVVVLGGLGLVDAARLRAARRYVWVGLLVAGMLLTPPDPLSQVLMAAPMALLYELCVLILRARERRRPHA